MKPRETGSEKLLAGLGKPCALDETHVRRFVEFLQENDFKLLDWHVKGQPRPDSISGSLQGGAEEVGATVQKLLRFSDLRISLEAFPIGIPWPEWYRIDFNAGPGL